MTEPDQIYLNFTSRIQEDLTRWEDRLAQERKDLEAYKQTLQLIGRGPKLRVDLGSNFFMNAELVNKKIIVKTIENIFVEVGHDEARKLIPAMIDIMERRIKTSLNMVAYIMASRQEIDLALEKFEA